MYKTMVLELILERPPLYRRLQRERLLKAMMETHAGTLKVRHQFWKDQLGQASPGTDPQQLTNQALEYALNDLRASLPNESSASEGGLTPDGEMRPSPIA